ncbi:MAG TPA: hypothetical protein VES60_13125 [Nakamurella sp.]|nr:hypothetical protein [Nakamurella sp.]
MLSTKGIKRLIAQAGLVAGALIAIGIVVLATRVVILSSTTADPASALHQVAELPAEADEMVDWAPDGWATERVMEPATRIAIEAAYVRAWAALGVYQSTGATGPVTATFSGPARTDALAVPRDEPVATWSVAHLLRLEFYSLDGATVALTDTDARLVRTAGTADTETVVDSAESYAVVMVLEDGYWRVRELRRDAVTQTVTTAYAGGVTEIADARTAAPVAAPVVNAVDYLPAGWPATPDTTIAEDFRQAKDLGVDTLRVRIPFDSLTAPANADQVAGLLTAAGPAGLQIILVLFEGEMDLSPASWAAADHSLTSLVGAVGNDPALVMWDVADQPDLRTGAATPTEIRAFLAHEVRLLRTLDPTVPVTISWSVPAAAADPAMVELVDVVSFHSTGTPADLTAAVQQMSAAAGTRPIMLVATTTATDGGWSAFPHSERRQAVEVAQVLQSAAENDVTRTSVNQLQDSAGDQRGLLRADGSAKPAAALLRPGAPLVGVSGSGAADYASSNFWRVAVAVLFFAVLFLVRHHVWTAGRALRLPGRSHR